MRAYVRYLVVPAAVAAFAVAGCGEQVTTKPATGSGSSGSGGGASIMSAELKIALTDDAGTVKDYTLDCDPGSGGASAQATGTVDEPKKACVAAAKVAADLFSDPPEDQVCAEVFVGPEKAKVTGTFDGNAVDQEYSRSNSCADARWRQVAELAGVAVDD